VLFMKALTVVIRNWRVNHKSASTILGSALDTKPVGAGNVDARIEKDSLYV
jgi:hypothetical protein